MKPNAKLTWMMLAAVLLLSPPLYVKAESKHTAERESIKSENSDVKTQVTFLNRSDRVIKIYWLDFDGNRVLYKTIQSLEGFAQITFLTHPWLVTDEEDNAWQLYYADAQPRSIEIIAPPVE